MLSEAMLRARVVINRMGNIAAGTMVSDYHESESSGRFPSRPRSCISNGWARNSTFWIARAHGFYQRRFGRVARGDFAVIVVNAAHGVSIGTDAAWKYATEDDIPKMIVINAFDKEGTNFEEVMAQLREHFGARVFPISLPINAGPGFNQLLDSIRDE